MKKTIKETAVEQTTTQQSNRENDQNNFEVAKKIAIYLVQVNNHGSALADFALFNGITSTSLVENATNGVVSARVTQDAIVLEETASGYELAFMTKFISDSHHEERLVEDIAQFISKAMDKVKQKTPIENVPETYNTDVVDTADEIDTIIINKYNSTFAARESEIHNYINDTTDFRTRKLRLYSKTCECLFCAGYKGDKNKDKVLSLLTPENRRRYDELLSLAA